VQTSGTTGLNKGWSLIAAKIAGVGPFMERIYNFTPEDRAALPTPLCEFHFVPADVAERVQQTIAQLLVAALQPPWPRVAPSWSCASSQQRTSFETAKRQE
jgi:hypothetical protein